MKLFSFRANERRLAFQRRNGGKSGLRNMGCSGIDEHTTQPSSITDTHLKTPFIDFSCRQKEATLLSVNFLPNYNQWLSC